MWLLLLLKEKQEMRNSFHQLLPDEPSSCSYGAIRIKERLRDATIVRADFIARMLASKISQSRHCDVDHSHAAAFLFGLFQP